MKLFVLAAFAALGFASASCPNMCSGHGNCKNDDMCECHRNWMAADCSERVCPYDWAFVTTPQGDLNMDGDIYDAMSYDDDTHYDDARQITSTASATNLLTIQMPGGDWEIWPSYGATTDGVSTASSNKDEGHFYMECSNRGLCDRKTGECECFDGYEGAGCRRTVCANDCSGHGTCESVTALTGGTDYKLWDGDKSMSCKCDPGYGAADCSERKCPTGDDPLTTTTAGAQAQRNENLWIDVNQVGDSTAPANGADVSGYIQLQYEDDFGETWWSDFVGPMAKYSDVTATDDALAAKIAAGFTGIPNGVFEKVSVTAHPIENILPGTLENGDDQANTALAINTNAAFASDTKWDAAFGCGGATGYCDQDAFESDWDLKVGSETVAVVKSTGWYAATNVPETADLTAAADNEPAYQVGIRGIRFQVNFTANSGDLNDFTCVTTDRFSNTETAITASSCTITSRPTFVGAEADMASGSTTILVSSDVTGDLSAGDRVRVDGDTDFTVSAVTYSAADSASTITTKETAGETFADVDLAKNMDGTTESAECSNRGLCDYESGTCACFQGYTGDDCGSQSTLAW